MSFAAVSFPRRPGRTPQTACALYNESSRNLSEDATSEHLFFCISSRCEAVCRTRSKMVFAADSHPRRPGLHIHLPYCTSNLPEFVRNNIRMVSLDIVRGKDVRRPLSATLFCISRSLSVLLGQTHTNRLKDPTESPRISWMFRKTQQPNATSTTLLWVRTLNLCRLHFSSVVSEDRLFRS